MCDLKKDNSKGKYKEQKFEIFIEIFKGGVSTV